MNAPRTKNATWIRVNVDGRYGYLHDFTKELGVSRKRTYSAYVRAGRPFKVSSEQILNYFADSKKTLPPVFGFYKGEKRPAAEIAKLIGISTTTAKRMIKKCGGYLTEKDIAFDESKRPQKVKKRKANNGPENFTPQSIAGMKSLSVAVISDALLLYTAPEGRVKETERASAAHFLFGGNEMFKFWAGALNVFDESLSAEEKKYIDANKEKIHARLKKIEGQEQGDSK